VTGTKHPVKQVRQIGAILVCSWQPAARRSAIYARNLRKLRQ
jgi:hypothetical protein